MATPLNSMTIEKIKSNCNKDKAVVNGFIYSLNRTSGVRVCELRGKCNARMNTRNDNIIKPSDVAQIARDHTHAPYPGSSSSSFRKAVS